MQFPEAVQKVLDSGFSTDQLRNIILMLCAQYQDEAELDEIVSHYCGNKISKKPFNPVDAFRRPGIDELLES